MGSRPFDHPRDLRPVGDITKIDQAQWGTGDDQTIEILLLNLLKIAIEVVQMFAWRIFDSRRSMRSN